MRRVGQTRKRDTAEAAIVAALHQVGAQFMRISAPGAPDLLVLFRGRVWLLECKSPSGRATIAQEAMKVAGWPVIVVRSPLDAVEAIGATAKDLLPNAVKAMALRDLDQAREDEKRAARPLKGVT